MPHVSGKSRFQPREAAAMGAVRVARCAFAVCAALFVAAQHPVPTHAQGPQPVDGVLAIPVDDFTFGADDEDALSVKGGFGVRSLGGQLAHALQVAVQNGNVVVQDTPIEGHGGQGEAHGDGEKAGNVQVNDPSLDHVTSFDPAVVRTRPFEFSTQSETSLTTNGKHVVVGYNSSAGAVVKFFPKQGVLAFTQLLFSAFSVSHDGGATWASGFVPPVSPGAPFTFGDPSLALDRHGNVFYASLGTDATGQNGAVIINKSSDNGQTFGAARVVVLDDGSDKEWLAIGPDPASPDRDNLYVTWTSFQAASSELRLARSIDGGATWSSKTLFAPTDDGVNSSFIQFSNPVVDASSGRLYVPFLHFSDSDADNVRVLVSDDGGQTFHFLAFNVPGAVDAFAYPNVTPGIINDCGRGGGGLRNVLHQGADAGGGRFGFNRFVQATRLISQPAAAAFDGRFLFALNTSTSPFFGDPTAGSEINVIFSPDGGASWAPPLRVAASTAADPQHVHPAVAVDDNGNRAWVTYYVQQANEQLRTDTTTVRVEDDHLKLKDTNPLSTQAFDLTPSNIPFPSAANPFRTTNYDRTVVACYDIGEYMSASAGNDPKRPIAAWGDNRNTWTGPAGSAAPFTHAQPDVFSGVLKK